MRVEQEYNLYQMVHKMAQDREGPSLDFEDMVKRPKDPSFGLSANAALGLVEDYQSMYECYEELYNLLFKYHQDMGMSKEMQDDFEGHRLALADLGEREQEWSEALYLGEANIRNRDRKVNTQNSLLGLNKGIPK